MILVGVQIDLEKAENPYRGTGRREGTSGNYKYFYDDGDGSGTSPQQAETTQGEQVRWDEPGTHQVPHPTIEGEQMSVNVRLVGTKGNIEISANAGDKTKKFPHRGGFEKWYMGTSETTILHDMGGRPWFELLPNVGRIRDGVLIPSTDPGKQWIIRFHESHPDYAAARKAKERVEWYKPKQEGGFKHHEKELRNQELIEGPPSEEAPPTEEIETEEAPPTEEVDAPQELSTELTSDQEEEAATQAGQEVPEEPTVPSSVVDRLQQGQIPYRSEPGLRGARRDRRVLDVPAAQKEQMIDEIARQFWPKIVKEASAAIRNPFFADNPGAWLPRFIGGQSFSMPAAYAMDATGKPIGVGLEPGSMAHRAISDALDNYDPSKGYFASYLAGSNGKLHWNMQRKESVNQFIKEVKASAPMEQGGGKEGETFERQTEGGTVRSGGGAWVQKPKSRTLADIQKPGKEEEAEEVSSTDPWIDQQGFALEQAAGQATHISPEVHDQLRGLFNQIRNVPPDQRAAYAERFSEALRSMGLEDYAVDVGKSLEQAAIQAILYEDAVKKGLAFLSKDKNVQDDHTYDHKEGDDDFPKFYYRDPNGNLIQYTNAPAGHTDSSGLYGDAAIHPSEPDPKKVPQYFTPDGRKMDRSPPEGAFPEWNQTYNRYDPRSLWIGRWPDAETGDYRYAYIDSDIRSLPKLQTNRMNVLHDDRLPELRQYIHDLFHSNVFKDQMTGLALALLDQGCFRAQELAALTTSHLYIEGSLIQLGHRKIYGDAKLQHAFDTLKNSKSPSEPLFSVPFLNKDGSSDEGLSRRMGPHYWARVLGQLGVSILSMQTYRATKTFSQEVQRYLTVYNMSWYQAVNQALLTVSLEWGHDLSQEQDAPRVTQLILETLIDPVLVQILQQQAQNLGLGQGQGTGAVPPSTLLIPAVSMELTGLTAEEQEFSQWLHSAPIHEHADMGMMKSDLMKAAYRGKGRREGTPGNYRYYYDKPKKGRSRKPEEMPGASTPQSPLPPQAPSPQQPSAIPGSA
jgi:hypothetical protein